MRLLTAFYQIDIFQNLNGKLNLSYGGKKLLSDKVSYSYYLVIFTFIFMLYPSLESFSTSVPELMSMEKNKPTLIRQSSMYFSLKMF